MGIIRIQTIKIILQCDRRFGLYPCSGRQEFEDDSFDECYRKAKDWGWQFTSYGDEIVCSECVIKDTRKKETSTGEIK